MHVQQHVCHLHCEQTLTGDAEAQADALFRLLRDKKML